ncbi:hypothetical protein [uncultured Aquimarina sp.]|uniref:hypothetical protein n=1 Tax=uncultured Aquimarina sp. TaxID=575652 RepID=UPI002622E703|nr:hypothetical protein [uncultured Aquimarina sp.]
MNTIKMIIKNIDPDTYPQSYPLLVCKALTIESNVAGMVDKTPSDKIAASSMNIIPDTFFILIEIIINLRLPQTGQPVISILM